VLATDFDRTLVGKDSVIRPRTRAAVARAHEAGLRTIVVTGRMFRSVRPYLLDAGMTDPVVCYQGAVVADPVSGAYLRHVPIDLEDAREALAALEGWPVNLYVDDLAPEEELAWIGRRLAVGDAELDEGNVWEAISDETIRGTRLDNVLWIVDLNRQSLDRVIPGIKVQEMEALFQGIGWQVLETVGVQLVQNQLRHSSQLYGTVGVVLGLIFFLSLVSQLTLYGLEINAVRVDRLWPRSIVQPPLTDADRELFRTMARQEERRDEQRVTVSFDDEASAGDVG